MKTAVIVPAFDVAPLVGGVIAELKAIWPDPEGVICVDDGSRDGSGEVARQAGAYLVRHGRNRGKGAALRSGFEAARHRGFDTAVTVDGDAQHPPAEALRMHEAVRAEDALVVGVRDLAKAGAPPANQLSNRFSNLVLSGFTGRALGDTQCGLRRYPVEQTLALGGREEGYGYEAEIVIRACAAGWPV
ncbi:MAG: glycosyltransferase family 2 protein, partial [Myxococcota bacterium]